MSSGDVFWRAAHSRHARPDLSPGLRHKASIVARGGIRRRMIIQAP
jgi:hypothetical protein